MAKPPFPRTTSGFIDEKEVFQLFIGTLGLPLDYFNQISFEEFGWLLEHHYEKEKNQYEILAHVISVGYARTQTKKKINLFDENSTTEVKMKKITKEEKQRKLEDLSEIFNKQ